MGYQNDKLMRIEFRRRLHEDRITFHTDLIIIPNKKECKQLDEYFNLAKYDFELQGKLTTDDSFNTYFNLTINSPKRKLSK